MAVNKFAICVCLATLGFVVAVEEFVAEIPQGSLKGIKSTTAYQGKPMYSFKGIPYAKPNVGPNKFRSPEPAEPWNGVLDATKHGSTCTFFCMVRQGIFGDDDCLYLNIYTPEVNKNTRKAVMVFIHGGGFNSGAGDDGFFGADFLVENDVVVVTMNYRLGAVGFLNTGDASAPGNAGLKDQALALKWVKENIWHFGGCGNRITIFGQSAGGTAVQYHMMSPMSQDLFKSAIVQSGSVGASWAYTFKPRESAFMLGEALGIKTTDSAELVKKLAEFSAKELVQASIEIAKNENHMNGFLAAFVPSAEANVGQEIFLPADPWELLKSGKIADVPLMTGMTTDESGWMSGMVTGQAAMLENNFDLFIPNDLNMTDAAQRKATGESMKKFYFKGKPISEDTKKEATELFSDVLYTYGCALTTEIINERNTAPVYEYLFNFYNPFGFMKTLFKMEEGITHGDELAYLWYGGAFKNKPAPGTPSEKMVQIMTELWTNFAKESNPTPNTNGVVKVKWEPKGKEDNYLEIDVEPTLKKGMFKERVNFWADIYKNVLGDYAKLFA